MKVQTIYKKFKQRFRLNWETGFFIAFCAFATLLLIFGDPITKVLTIVVGALYFFMTEKLPVDMTAMLIMILLMISGLVTPTEGVSGFSNSATITVLCMFILSKGIENTGIIHKVGNLVFRWTGDSQVLQMLAVAILVAPISGFINNTAAVAIFLPMILAMSKRTGMSATKLLIPLSFLSMMGGTLTLIGTSTNILANSVLKQEGIEPFSMFTFTNVGVIILAVGVIYMLSFGRLLLPDRKDNSSDSSERWVQDFLIEIQVLKGSSLIGKTLQDLKFKDRYQSRVIKIIRGGQSIIQSVGRKKIEENDIMVLYGNEKQVIEFDKFENEKLLLDFDPEAKMRESKDNKIVKVVQKNPRYFADRTVEEIQFQKKYGASIVGIHRPDQELNTKSLAKMKLKPGEILLIKASPAQLQAIEDSEDFLILEEIKHSYNPKKTITAVSIMTLIILLATFNIMPIMVAALMGVFLMFLTRCIEPSELYKSINWEVIFLLAGVIPLGIAMTKNGAADVLADLIVKNASHLHPLILMGLFYLITTLITEIISNNATVVLLIPIAIQVSEKMHYNPWSLALIIMFAASTSFLSPVGYQTNTMVYSAGNYKFSDFIKVGGLLNLILMILTTLLVYYFFGI